MIFHISLQIPVVFHLRIIQSPSQKQIIAPPAQSYLHRAHNHHDKILLPVPASSRAAAHRIRREAFRPLAGTGCKARLRASNGLYRNAPEGLCGLQAVPPDHGVDPGHPGKARRCAAGPGPGPMTFVPGSMPKTIFSAFPSFVICSLCLLSLFLFRACASLP